MSTEKPSPEPFVPLRVAAIRLGLPAAWLRAEVVAGRVPHLLAGRRILINPAEVERVLLERARHAGAATTATSQKEVAGE